ncbi:hypothetical protein [Rhodonellum sp.]|uniref:hypothetical protein n=1 Tax=Rhodonellum sp. TaxID=2231180 RepID=UPI002721023D|nr:hypothetical protein [Rhodonellum sp.]MDO9553048.1 hypothetical protein [Rhodonellum sp.]
MFEIDYITIGFAVVLSVAFMTPLYLNHRKNKKIEETENQFLAALAKEKGLHFSHKEIWRNRYMLGLDTQLKKLVYVHFEEVPVVIEIDLDQIQSIEIHEKTHEIGGEKEKRKVTDNLDLTFHTRNPQRRQVTLEFYDAEKFSDLNGELPLIRNWQSLLQSNLKIKELVSAV